MERTQPSAAGGDGAPTARRRTWARLNHAVLEISCWRSLLRSVSVCLGLRDVASPRPNEEARRLC